MKIVLSAPLLTKSGYGVHSRQIFEILERFCKSEGHELFVSLLGWGNCGWYLGQDTLDGQAQKIISYAKQMPRIVDLHVIVDLPNKFIEKFSFSAKKTIGITAGVEATETPKAWANIVNHPGLNATIVPSKFTQSGFVKSGASSSKIHVIPESYFPEVLETHELDISLPCDDNVLFVSQIHPNPIVDRKNFFNTMRALQGGLKNLPNVGIVLKLNSIGRGSFDRIKTRKTLQDMKAQMNIQNPITLVHGELDNREMAGLYQHAKISCLFTMTRGEGFGLPLLEAAASGLPIIASNWSAHPEFLDHKFIKIKGREVPVPSEKLDGQVWSGGNWFEPDADKAAKLLYRFFNDVQLRKDSKKNAKTLQNSVQNRYSLDKIYHKYVDLIRSV